MENGINELLNWDLLSILANDVIHTICVFMEVHLFAVLTHFPKRSSIDEKSRMNLEGIQV